MPRLIVKCPYIKGGGAKAATQLNNYVKYVATREGVELAEAMKIPPDQFRWYTDKERVSL
jgi:hypothetical protein